MTIEVLPTIDSPNFSIVLPGPCNARCGFCFWRRDPEEAEGHVFCQNLMEVVKKLPKQFWQVSITGGEPTLSPVLNNVLTILEESRRFKKVVLTTNGTALENQFGSAHFGVVTNVNISRHSAGDQENRAVFNWSMGIPSLAELSNLNNELNRLGIESCVNCVITPALDSPREFVSIMRNVYFTEATFRKPHTAKSDLSMTSLERGIASRHHRVAHSECPVCRSNLYLLGGMRTWWTASIAEPTDVMVDKVYELVFHPDGKLYADWSKQIEVEL